VIRYLFGFLCVCALVATSPQSASAQASEEAVPKVALATPTQHRLPPQLVLRASYFLYLDEDADNGGTSDQPKLDGSGEEEHGSNLEWLEWSDLQWMQWLLRVEQRVDAEPATRSSPLSEGSWLRLELDFAGMRVVTRPPPLSEETERRRRRRVGIGVGVTIAIVAVGLAVGAAAAAASISVD